MICCFSRGRGVVNTVAEFMESVANGVSDLYEVISSEDNLYRIHKANTEVEEWRNENLRIIKFCHVTCEDCADVVRETLSNCGTCKVEFEELKKSANNTDYLNGRMNNCAGDDDDGKFTSQAGNSEDGKFTSPAGKGAFKYYISRFYSNADLPPPCISKISARLDTPPPPTLLM